MIRKECKIPLKAEQLDALLRRLPLDHPQRSQMKDEYAKSKAGYKGEESLDYYLNLLDTKKYLIFHDLRLPYQSSYFQLDILLLSSSFFLILEVKNIKGIIYIDHATNQFIRILDDREEGFPNPLIQVNLQQRQLIKWLESNKISVPVKTLVVISNPSTIIKSSNSAGYRLKQIIHSANLLTKIDEFEQIHKQVTQSAKELRKVERLLIKHHTPKYLNILEKFKIKESNLLTGVQCPSCSTLPMIRKHGIWECPSCKIKSKDAHLKALKDYSLLIRPTITNQQLRHFLQLSSRSISTYPLNEMNLEYTGKLRGRVYNLPQIESSF